MPISLNLKNKILNSYSILTSPKHIFKRKIKSNVATRKSKFSSKIEQDNLTDSDGGGH